MQHNLLRSNQIAIKVCIWGYTLRCQEYTVKLAHAKIMLKNSIREYTIVPSTIGYLIRQTLYYISYIFQNRILSIVVQKQNLKYKSLNPKCFQPCHNYPNRFEGQQRSIYTPLPFSLLH